MNNVRAFLHAWRMGWAAARDAWACARGNPKIAYRFHIGQRVKYGLSPSATVIRRCSLDESYELSDGSTCPGYALRPVGAYPPFPMPGGPA